VISAADKLKAIVFTGAGYKEFIPGLAEATAKGIAVANAPGGNAAAVAEYTLTLILAMTRNVFGLGRTGKDNFRTTPSLHDLEVGIIGLGSVGLLVALNLKSLGVNSIRYFTPHRKYHL